jgi:hypothetical protein
MASTSFAEDVGHPTPDAKPVVAVDLSASPAQVNVGDSVTVTVTYRWPRGWSVRHEPDPGAVFAGEFVTNLPPARKLDTGDEERRLFTLTLVARRSGAWSLPRPTLATTGPAGKVEATAPEVIVQVGTEAKPVQLPPPRPAWTRPPAPGQILHSWLTWALIALVLVGAAAAFLFWRRRVATPPPTAWQVFARDWEAAGATADGKEAGARLSLALRRCAGTVFRFDGPGSTTRETAFTLRGRLPDDEHADLIRLLDQLDQLRWAAEALPASAIRPQLTAARAWTQGLRQRLDAEAAAEAARRAQAGQTVVAPDRTARP